MRRVRVIACGSADSADDAAGPAAVRSVAARLSAIPGVDVAHAVNTDSILDLLDGVDAAVLVDAVRVNGDGEPGRLVRSSAGPDGLPPSVAPVLSTHGFGVMDAVSLAAALGRRPAAAFLGVEAGDTRPGNAMTEPVVGALPNLAEAVVALVRRLASEGDDSR